MRRKPKINLRHDIGLGLIILRKTGVIISNQTGGFACHHPEVEGFYIPLAKEVHPLLEKHFAGDDGKWKGNCSDGIDKETAIFINSLFLDEFENLSFSVDSSKLKESHEAWIYVDILWSKGDRDCDIAYGFNGCRGILTWENSD